VAQHFTGDKKDDLTPADIFRMHAQGPEERAVVARYCIQDCALVSDLVQKLNTLPNAIGMADVCLVPTSYIFLRGQGCKILSLVAKRCRLDGFALPELRRQEAEGYDGAFVLNPRIGVYLDTPVAVLDFASLYPSSMIATNLSHDTMLADDQPDPEGLEVEAVSFVLRDKAGNEREVTKRFVQAGPNDEHEGVLPRTLKVLLSNRASVRKQMKTVDDPFQRAVMDGMQLAYKVTANSLYGQLGSATSDICCVEIAASTTAVGRSMLIKLKDFVENERRGEVVYGDSVADYTPVFIRHHCKVELITVEDVAFRIGLDAWAPCADAGREGKEFIELEGVEVWSDMGWSRAHRLIRHRLAPHKRMLRVTTGSGVVDVTDDHSLLRPDGTIVKPNELKVGDLLMHADVPELPVSDEELHGELQVLDCGRSVVAVADQLSAARIFSMASTAGHTLSVGSGSVLGCETVLKFFEPSASDAVKSVVELPSRGFQQVYDFTTDNHHFSAGVGRIVVSNTDSCMVTFPRECDQLKGKDAVAATIKAAQDCSDEFLKIIKKPQKAEYEYVFWPFVLISKKRYVSNVYETDPYAKPKQKFMGVVLTRRDNAPIVKRIFGGVIDRILNGADIADAVAFVKQVLAELVAGEVPLSELIVTKNLGSEYADPDRIAHAVLARRMAERDPGSAPAVGDRVPYVYVVNDTKGALQGDRIEHPDHLNGAAIDYSFYITNQVMKPVAQLFCLMVHDIPGCRLTRDEMDMKHVVHMNECQGDEVKARKKDDAIKMKEVIRLIFEDSLRECELKRMGMRDVSSFLRL
jgi:DNA polymerase elongation subunit (family B)